MEDVKIIFFGGKSHKWTTERNMYMFNIIGHTRQGSVLLVGARRGLWKEVHSFFHSSGLVTYKKWPMGKNMQMFNVTTLKKKITLLYLDIQVFPLVSAKTGLQVPEAEFVEWSLPGPFRGSDIEIDICCALVQFSVDKVLKSHPQRSSSKSHLINFSATGKHSDAMKMWCLELH